jgi:hypothetical protein
MTHARTPALGMSITLLATLAVALPARGRPGKLGWWVGLSLLGLLRWRRSGRRR